MISFLQTDRWAQFQKSLGRQVFFVSGENWRGLLIKRTLPLGKNYLYCPRGPMPASYQIVEEFLDKVAEIAKQEKSIFLRWDPPFAENEFSFKKLSAISYKLKAVRSVQPQHTLVIDLTKPEEVLLAEMHEKTRYNIRLAERRGVLVKQVPAESGIETFWDLLRQTAKRDGFSPHAKSHYEKLVEVFGEAQEEKAPFIRLYVAEYNHMPLAASLIMFHGDAVTYLHGASSNEHRDVMAPHLLHWRIMQDAKKDGYAAYDFWGINPSTSLGAGDQNPHWAGITRFKRGFGGTAFSYADSHDIVYKKHWYAAYSLAKKFF